MLRHAALAVLATAAGAAPVQAAEPALLAQVGDQLVVIDSSGATMASERTYGISGVSVCPGSRLAVITGYPDVAVVSLPSLAPVQSVQQPEPAPKESPDPETCVEPTATRLVSFSQTLGEAGLFRSGPEPRTLWEGIAGQAVISGGWAYISGQEGVTAVRLSDGRARLLGSAPFGNDFFAISRDGRDVASYGERGLAILDTSGRRRHRTSRDGTTDAVWLTGRRLAVGRGRETVVYDRRLRPVRRIRSTVRFTHAAGSVLYGSTERAVHVVSPRGRPRVLVRFSGKQTRSSTSEDDLVILAAIP